jgi:hypothetical protein
MWVLFIETKDETCSQLEIIVLNAKNIRHARFHTAYGASAPVTMFDSDAVFEAASTQSICAQCGYTLRFSAPYTHHMLGKAERP